MIDAMIRAAALAGSIVLVWFLPLWAVALLVAFVIAVGMMRSSYTLGFRRGRPDL